MTTDTKAVARWDWDMARLRMDTFDDGRYVRFTDHEQVVRELKEERMRWFLRAGEYLKRAQAAETALAASRAEVEGLRRTMEIIAVGDSRNAMSDATEALVAYGFWTAMENGNV